MGSYNDGWCYLLLFDEAKRLCGLEIDDVSKSLGIYPTIHDVLVTLLKGVDSDILLPAVVPTLSGVLHVTGEVRESLSAIACKFLFCKLRVGADVQPILDDACVARTIQGLMKETNFGYERVQERVANARLMQYHPGQMAAAIVSTDSSKENISLGQKLDTKEQLMLMDAFPEFNIRFRCADGVPHPLAAAVRTCMMRLMLYKVGYSNKRTTSERKMRRVIDIGANWADHAVAGRYDIHSCSPMMNWYDSQRETERLTRLERCSMPASLLRAYIDGNGVGSRNVRCMNPVQSCSERAEYGIMMHSLYDIPEEDLMKAVDAHRFRMMYAVLHFSPLMLTESSGRLISGCDWIIREEKVDGKIMRRIDFSFIGESTHMYSHNYDSYINWMRRSVFMTPKGTVVMKEVIDCRLDHVVLKFVSCYNVPLNSRLEVRTRYWCGNGEDLVFVRVFTFEKRWYLKCGEALDKTIKVKYVPASRIFVDNLLAYCARSNTAEFNVSSVNSAASSYNNRITINGQNIYSSYKLSSCDLPLVAAALYMKAYIMKYESGQLMKLFTDQEKEKRQSSSLSFSDVFLRLLTYICPTSQKTVEGQISSNYVFPKFSELWNNAKGKMHEWKQTRCIIPNIEEIGTICEITEMMDLRANSEVTDDITAVLLQANSSNLQEKETTQRITEEVITEVIGNKINKGKITRKRDVEVIDYCGSDSGDSGFCVSSSLGDSDSIISEVSVKSNKKKKKERDLAISAYVKSLDPDSNKLRTRESNRDMLRAFRLNEEECEYRHAEITKVPGDGKCCYSALLKALKLNIDVEPFKRVLSYSLTTAEMESGLKDLLTVDSGPGRDTWGTTDVLTLVGRLWDIDVCLHVGEHTAKLCTGPNGKIHIRYSNEHFDTVVTDEISVSYSVEKFMRLLSNCLDNIGLNRKLSARRRYDEYSRVSEVGKFMNRSAYKLLEILDRYSLKLESGSILDVGGAPGGFVQVLTGLNYKGLTISNEVIPYSDEVMMSDWDVIRNDFKKQSFDSKYSLVLCDLFDDTSFDAYDIDVMIKCDLLVIEGGSLVIKLPIYSLDKLPLLKYERVEVFKPKFSRAASCEIYLICENKREEESIGISVDVNYDGLLSAVSKYVEAITDSSIDCRKPTAIITQMTLDMLERICLKYKGRSGGYDFGLEHPDLSDEGGIMVSDCQLDTLIPPPIEFAGTIETKLIENVTFMEELVDKLNDLDIRVEQKTAEFGDKRYTLPIDTVYLVNFKRFMTLLVEAMRSRHLVECVTDLLEFTSKEFEKLALKEKSIFANELNGVTSELKLLNIMEIEIDAYIRRYFGVHREVLSALVQKLSSLGSINNAHFVEAVRGALPSIAVYLCNYDISDDVRKGRRKNLFNKLGKLFKQHNVPMDTNSDRCANRSYGMVGTITTSVGSTKNAIKTSKHHIDNVKTVSHMRGAITVCDMGVGTSSDDCVVALPRSLSAKGKRKVVVKTVSVQTGEEDEIEVANVITEQEPVPKDKHKRKTKTKLKPGKPNDEIDEKDCEEDLIIDEDISSRFDGMMENNTTELNCIVGDFPDELVQYFKTKNSLNECKAALLTRSTFGDKQWACLFVDNEVHRSEMLCKFIKREFVNKRSCCVMDGVNFLPFGDKLFVICMLSHDKVEGSVYSALSRMFRHFDKRVNVAVDPSALHYDGLMNRLVDLGFLLSVCVTSTNYDRANSVVFSSNANVLRTPPEGIPITFPAVDKNVVKYLTEPKYILGHTIDKNFLNSAVEFFHLSEVLDDVWDEDLRRFFRDHMLNDGFGVAGMELIKRNDYSLWDNVLRKIVYGKPREEFEYGHDGDGFVRFGVDDENVDDDEQQFNTDKRLIIITKETEVMLNAKLVNACKKISVVEVLPVIKFVNGAPGCGKTTYIVDRVNFKLSDGDLLLTATKAGAEEIKERIKAKGVSPKLCDRDIRTISSYVMHGSGSKSVVEKRKVRQEVTYERMFIDEALMVHAGLIAYAISRAKVREVVMLGDKNQIPFIDRYGLLPLKYSDLFMWCGVSEERNVTYRCPMDVTCALEKFYPGLRTTNSNSASVSLSALSECVPKINGALYLTWTQDDKAKLKLDGYDKYGKVLTIHEAQGQTFKQVLMVRYQVKDLELFKSTPHAIVAISRHTESLKYFTPVDDALTSLIRGAANSTSQQRLAVLKCSGGWVPEDIGVALSFDDGRHSDKKYLDVACAEMHSPIVPVVLRPEVSRAKLEGTELMVCDTWKNVDSLQMMYDKVFPGCSYMQTDYQDLVESSDLELMIDHIRVNPVCAELFPKKSRFEPMIPVLKTLQPQQREPSQRESILAYMKRNGNAPRLCADLPPQEMGLTMFRNFVGSAIDPEKFDEYRKFSEDIVGVNERAIIAWLRMQPVGTESLLDTELDVSVRKYNEFNFMIKTQVKPPLDRKALDTYAALQTIAYNSKDCNMIFCPVINCIRDRILSVLKNNIIMYTGMSSEEMNDRLSNLLNGVNMHEYERLENDFAKFDKSQLEVVYWFEYYLFKSFGMDEYLLDIYLNANRASRFYDAKHGVSANVNYQRKSGGATTWLGNTLFTLCVLLCVYDIEDIIAMLVAGDDSFVLARKRMKDRSHLLMTLFNLESKLLRYQYPYFCSKFLIQTDGETLLVPDPVKFITKLGRKDLRNWQHVEEYRVSCMDNYKAYSRMELYGVLTEAVVERYGADFNNLDGVFKTIWNLVRDEESFKELYSEPEGEMNMSLQGLKMDLARTSATGLKKFVDDTYVLYCGQLRSGREDVEPFVIYHPRLEVLEEFIDSLGDSERAFTVLADSMSDVKGPYLVLSACEKVLREVKDRRRLFAIIPESVNGVERKRINVVKQLITNRLFESVSTDKRLIDLLFIG